MEYFKGIVKALVPRKWKDIIAMSLLVPAMSYTGYRIFYPKPPVTSVYTETVYPKEVVRGSYFFLSFDLSWNQTCDVYAKRYIIGSDGIEYLAAEDFKQVIKDQRTRYVARIPVGLNIPLGKATVRSDFSYECDWFSRYIRATEVTGRNRYIEVVREVGESETSRKESLSKF